MPVPTYISLILIVIVLYSFSIFFFNNRAYNSYFFSDFTVLLNLKTSSIYLPFNLKLKKFKTMSSCNLKSKRLPYFI